MRPLKGSVQEQKKIPTKYTEIHQNLYDYDATNGSGTGWEAPQHVGNDKIAGLDEVSRYESGRCGSYEQNLDEARNGAGHLEEEESCRGVDGSHGKTNRLVTEKPAPEVEWDVTIVGQEVWMIVGEVSEREW